MNSYWMIMSGNMRSSPSLSAQKIVTVPKDQKVEVLEVSNNWAKCQWRNFSGHIYFPMLEEYILPEGETEEFDDVVYIPDNMIPNPREIGRQYIRVDNKPRTNKNLCGQFCSAYCADDSIDGFLSKWKKYSPYNYNVFVTKDSGTGVSILRNMVEMYGLKSEDFRGGLSDPLVGALVSPGRIQKKLETHNNIIGLKINSSGKVQRTGIGHWVSIVDIEPFGINDGKVTIYNPFPNKFEVVGYKALMESMGNWSVLTGIWVEKPKNP